MNETQPQADPPTMLDWLLGHWWILLLVVAVLLLVLLYVLVVRARRAEPEADEEEKEEPVAEEDRAATPFARKDPEVEGLKASFLKRLAWLKDHVPGGTYRYQLPWYLLIGEEGQGKTTLLENIGLPMATGKPPQPRLHDVNWWFFQDALVLDVPGDYLLASDPDATRNRLWKTLLRLLQRHRRRRPIDGVILALPCTDLFGPEALTPEVIAYKAELIYEKLLEAQRLLGLRVPVYVLVTKCDCIASFKGYIHELPHAYRDTIFGWSNPYAIDTVYASGWADEAFDALAETLYRSQFELMADGMHSDNPDGFFLFPTAFQQLREPVRHYLDRIFRTSAYHDAFYLRGVYFTGDGAGEMGLVPGLASNGVHGAPAPTGPAEPPAAEPDALEYRPRPVFLTQLFGTKIFPEFKLAAPISQLFRWRHSTARALQWASLLVFVIWGLGLLYSYNRLDPLLNGSEGVINVVEIIDRNIQDIDTFEATSTSQRITNAILVRETKVLIERFAALKSSFAWSLFIPASWPLFSAIDEEVQDAFAAAYERFIFRLVRIELGLEVTRLYEPCETTPEPPQLLYLEDLTNFGRLYQYVTGIDALEKQVTLYNGLKQARGRRALEDLSEILTFLFRREGYQIPPGFLRNYGLYGSALSAIGVEHPFDPYAFAPDQSREVNTKSDILVACLYTDLYRKNALIRELALLKEHLETVNTLDRQNLSSGQEKAVLVQTLGLIEDVEVWLGDPRIAYLQHQTGRRGDTLSLGQLVGPAFEALVDRMEASTLFNRASTNRESYRSLSLSALRRAQSDLLAQEIPPTSQHMLVPGQDRRLDLSPDLLKVKNAIIKLLDQHAADAQGPQPIPRFRDGYSLMWNLNLLEEAVALPDQYPGVTTSSERALVTLLITDRMAQAATFAFDPAAFDPYVSEGELRPQVQNFDEALPLITGVLNRFQELGAREQGRALAQLASVQAYTLLEQVYALLWATGLQSGATRPFYSLDVAGANWTWTPGEPLYTAVFKDDDPAAVEAYLAAQRASVMFLNADFARPLLAMLNSPHARYAPNSPDLIADWNRIAQVLQAYAQKQPGNSLSRLETFVGQVMQTTTPDSCLQVLAASSTSGDDYFLDRLTDLKEDLRFICRHVALDEATAEYERLQADFNDFVGRHYPFDAQATGAQADPQALRRFFTEYDQFAETYLPYVEGNLTDPNLPAFFRDPDLPVFFRDMAGVRDFYAPFLDHEDDTAPPQYEFDIDFRVERRREVSGSNIIAWQLMVGDRAIGIRDTVHTGTWTYGEPVRLMLRWAKDGPLGPVDAGLPTVRTDIEARRVTFEFLQGWALLALLDQHRLRSYDPDPITLQFRIPVRRVGAPAEVVPDTSVVYLRMAIRPPGSNQVLTYPASFPRRVP